MKNKFKPSDLKNFKENDFENLTFDEQKELASEELASKDFDMMNIKMSNNAFRSKERMQTQWSNLLMVYLVIFTISMFTTLWFNGQCGVMWIEKFCISNLSDTTLNFLITVGFVKVVGVVWIIVRHLFPDTK
jgi:hypothetical protein